MSEWDPMDLAAAFYLSVYGLAALAGGILAWAEQTPSVTALTPPIAVAALLLNERFRLLRLDGFWIAGVGLAAFIFPTYELFVGKEEARLLAGAHLLAILQWVLMFYNKSAHQYWWICALSCLQIALAALLTSSPLFGVLILIYMFLALWTLSVFTLLLARLRYGREEHPKADWEWPQLRADEVVTGRPTVDAGLAPQVVRDSGGSEFRSTFQGNAHEADINWRFVFGVCGLSSAALFLGLIFFLLTPRLWMGVGSPFQDANLLGSAAVTGYSEKVQLRDFGRILESSAPVLELSLSDEKTNSPLHLHEYLSRIGQIEPLLRGSILTTYQDGEWFPFASAPPNRFSQNPSGFGTPERSRYIRQTIRLEAGASRTAFSLTDPEYGRVDDQAGEIRIYHDTRTLVLSMQAGGIRGAVRYHLLTPERTGDPHPPRYQISADDTFQAKNSSHRRSRLVPNYLEVPFGLPFTRDLALRLQERARARLASAEPTPTQLAETIVSYLRDSGVYQYSLDQTRVDPNVDPIEDFLQNRKTGHCQYFATSLALLLRALNIQSRVVTGFKGGIETADVGRLEVQQRHAHAWVEAYLNDAWVTLDATPAVARDESVAAVGERVRWYHNVFSLAGGLWNDYVVNLSFTKQQRDLYAPMQSLAAMLTKQIASLSNFGSVLQAHLERFWKHPEEWFSVSGGVTAFLLMLSLVGFFYLGRYLWWLIIRISLGVDGRKRGKTYVEFYERFLTLVKPLGFVPKSNQTQLEFAQLVTEGWATHQLPPEFRSLAEEISVAFYRLRFGSEVLTPDQEESIRSRLKEFELQVRKKS